ncbi:MAG: cob(I)yrinic acid a,c-diamide adenosyltransferase [Atribacterota bacterium]|nr:cob(I)yrinic acid a,c-diamide adenosyltransferase [Atribacterota bacterium]
MNGLIQVYTGNGKGKTTAALGLAIRAAGRNKKILIIQFMKKWDYGELHSIKHIPEIKIKTYGTNDFVFKGKAKDIDYEEAKKAFTEGVEGAFSGQFDIIIFDELNVALDFELLTLEAVLDFLDKKPASVEIIITGRNAPQQLIEKADLVTEMNEIKHPFQRGIEARIGIEY